jgi:hypothetical protein
MEMRSMGFVKPIGSAALAACMALVLAGGASAAALPKLTLAVSKQSIKVSGAMVSGAVEIATTVTGEAEDNPLLVRLKPGVTAGEFINVVSHLGQEGDLNVVDAYATIAYNGGDSPAGQTTDAYADLPAGNYLALSNGSGHAAFTIKKSSSTATLPTPQATVTSIDFGFHGPTTLHDGELVRFHNHGVLIHMFQLAKVASPADASLAEAQLLAGNVNGAKKYVVAPLAILAGPLSSGVGQESVITAAPGTYVLFCSMNTQDGREHFQLGMYRTITIVK